MNKEGQSVLTIEGTINPLLLFFGSKTEGDFLREIASGYPETPIEEILERYAEVNNPYHLNFVPSDNLITTRLLEPVRSAKINYCLGHYLAAIALCGAACEMCTLFQYEAFCEIALPESYPPEIFKFLTERKFEKPSTGQARRLELLKYLPFHFEHFVEEAEKCRLLRNKYMHVLNLDLAEIRQDAKEALLASLAALDTIIGLHPSNTDPGTLGLSPGIFREYILKKGLINNASSQAKI